MIKEQKIYPIKSLPDLAETYLRNVEKIKQAYIMLQEAREELNLDFSGSSYYSHVEVLTADREYSPQTACEKVITRIKQTAWKHAFDRLGVRKVLSVKRMEEYDKVFSGEGEDELPEFTYQNVSEHFAGLMNTAQVYLKEAVVEAYDYLRPGADSRSWHKAKKTNMKHGRYALGKKIILQNLIDTSLDRYYVNRYCGRDNGLISVDRVFHSLDGKMDSNSYKSDLVDAINTSNGTGETEYFKFKACKNGNLHIEFKRMDLVSKLNQLAGCETALQE
jgi:hypothetical protein